MSLLKITNTTGNWWMHHPELRGANYNIRFDWYLGDTATSYILSDDTDVVIQSALPTGTYRVIVFAEMPGWRHFGHYTGNGLTDGAIINMVGSPKWVVRKYRSLDDSESWHVSDASRLGYNLTAWDYQIDASNQESTNASMDLLSNGMKIRNTSVISNGASNNYITWAETTPFGGFGGTFGASNGASPTSAR